MKKKYIQPTTKLHNVGVHQMLCESPNGLMRTMNDSANNPDEDSNNLGKDDLDFGW